MDSLKKQVQKNERIAQRPLDTNLITLRNDFEKNLITVLPLRRNTDLYGPVGKPGGHWKDS